MYLQITKSEQWHETYISTMSDNSTSLACKPVSYDEFASYKKHFSDLEGFEVIDIDENSFNIKEK